MLTSVTSNVTLLFAPLATGPNFGSSDSIGLLKGQSEMSLIGMSSDPNDAVKQCGSDFNDIVEITEETCMKHWSTVISINLHSGKKKDS